MVHLVTGYAGYEHIQSKDQGAFNAIAFGRGQLVMNEGNKFGASIIDNNTVRVRDGEMLMYGRHIRIEPSSFEDCVIRTGTAGKNRTDLICMTYEKNADDGTEKAYLQVVQGSEVEGTPTLPTYTNGNILQGASFNQMPLYKVNIEGVVLKSIEKLFEIGGNYQEQIDNIANKIDTIQTTSSGTLSSAGWYRVAEYRAELSNEILGSLANACNLFIKKSYTNTHSEFYEISFRARYGVWEFALLNALSLDQAVTKIRHVYTDSTAYLEIYYAQNSSNTLSFEITHGSDMARKWQAITPTLTSETVSGVTVTCTYDIPANASPVTDLDLVRFEGETLSTSILAKAVELSNGVYNFKLNGSSYSGGDLPHNNYKYGMASVFKNTASEITVMLWGASPSGTRTIAVNYYNGAWLGWNTFATTSDLETHSYTSLGSFASGDELITALNDLHTNMTDMTSYQRRFTLTSKYSLLEVGVYVVEGFRQNNNYGYQLFKKIGANVLYSRYCNMTTWKDIDKYTTTSDLANYLGRGNTRVNNISFDDTNLLSITIDGTRYSIPFSTTPNTLAYFNGTATGNLALDGGRVGSNDTTGVPLELNTKGNYNLLKYMIGGNIAGYLGFDAINSPIYGDKSGNTKTLLHSGNFADYALAKYGSAKQTVNAPADVPIALNSTYDGGVAVLLGYFLNGVKQGHAGFLNGKYIVQDANNNVYYALHTGNSSPVVVSSSAPSDTSAVWVVPSS